MSLKVQRTLGFPATRSRSCSRAKPGKQVELPAGATEQPAIARRELFPSARLSSTHHEGPTSDGGHRWKDPAANASGHGRCDSWAELQQQRQVGRSYDYGRSGLPEQETHFVSAATPTKHCQTNAATPTRRAEKQPQSPLPSCRDTNPAASPNRSGVRPPDAISPPPHRRCALTPSKRSGTSCDSAEEASPSKLQRQLQKQPLQYHSSSGRCTPLSPSKMNSVCAGATKCGRPAVVSASTPTKQCKENVPAVLGHAVSPCHGGPVAASLEKHNNSTPRRSLAFGCTGEPRTAVDDDVELLQRAKRALHTAQPSSMCCRDNEAAEIRAFLTEHVQDCKAGSMYISGAPGTGKTALLRQVLDEFELPCQKIYVNCMSTKSWSQLYERIGEGLRPPAAAAKSKASGSSSGRCPTTASQLQKALCTGAGSSGGERGQRVVLVLDEIDQLHSRSQEVLYTIFEWPTFANSRLVLIGIANALDLTDRLLPRLHARPNCKPKLLHFSPYTKDQIQQIISRRLVESEAGGAVDAMAIQFCSRKIAAVTGDVRKALDICRRSIEVLEVERKLRVTPVPAAKGHAVLKPAVSLQTMVNLLSDNRCQSADAAETGLPLQQKLAACCLLLLFKHGKLKEVTFGKLHDTYSKVCRRRDVVPTDQSEFLNVCTLLETRGILSLKKAKNDCRTSKVSLKVDEMELERSLQDKLLVTSVLSEGLP